MSQTSRCASQRSLQSRRSGGETHLGSKSTIPTAGEFPGCGKTEVPPAGFTITRNSFEM
jgi:hypothetical protein